MLLLTVFAVCVILIAWMSAAETACFSLSRVEVRRLRAAGPRGRTLGRLLDDPPRLLSTILIANTAASVAASAAAAGMLQSALALDRTTVILLDAVLTSLAILILGEITPKSLAVHHAEPIALAVAPVLAATEAVLRPLTAALGAFGAWLERRVRAPARPKDQTADLVATIEAGREEGVLAHGERELLLGALAYGGRTAAQVMRPWPRVLTIPASMAAGDALARLAARRVSRAPVIGAGGRVVGVVRVQDLLPLVTGDETARGVGEVMRPAFFVTPDTPLTLALRTIRRDRTYMLVVAADPARPLGLLTLRDLIEELLAPARAGTRPVRHGQGAAAEASA